MAGFFREHSGSLFLSVLLHGLLAAAFIVAAMFTFKSKPTASVEPLPIDARVIDSQVFKAAQQQLADRAAQEAARAKAQADALAAAKAKEIEDAKRVEDEAAQAALAEKTAAADRDAQATAAAKAAEAERQAQTAQAAQVKRAQDQKRADDARRANESAQRAVEARRADDARKAADAKAAEDARKAADAKAADDAKHAADAKDKAAREAELRRQLADEEHTNSVASGPLADQYKAMLRARIEHAWIRPPSAGTSLDCLVEVTQVPGGEVTGVNVTQCNGDPATRESVENAVRRASPLPAPPDPALFVRKFSFHFHPDQ